MRKAQRPDTWMTETLMLLHVSKDYSVGTPGIRVDGSIPRHPGMTRHHWPTVQGKLTASQLEDIVDVVGDLVYGRLLHAGILGDLDETSSVP